MKRNGRSRLGLGLAIAGFAALVIPIRLAAQEPLSAWDPAADTGAPASAINFNQLAILRWYQANRTTTFPVGSVPTGVAFDGASMWVANFNDNNVTKLRASDGTASGA